MIKSIGLIEKMIEKYEHRLGTTLASKTASLTGNITNTGLSRSGVEDLHQGDSAKVSIDLAQAPYDLFPLIDIRIGNLVDCWIHPESDTLYCEKIDIGEKSLREVGSALQKHVPISEMIGKVLLFSNIKPRKLGGFLSNGMVLVIHAPLGIHLARPVNADIGERVGLEDTVKPGKGEVLEMLNPKKKVLEKCKDYFCTDSQGFMCFGVKKLITTAGFIDLKYPNAKIS